MKTITQFEYPAHLVPSYHKAKKLAWLSIAYLISTGLLMYFLMGQSQSMKTAWVEDVISLIPGISFLLATKIVIKKPTSQFPFGFHRASSIAYLVSALALVGVGGYLFIDSSIILIKQEPINIATVNIFGFSVWQGYLMIAALLYASIPAIFLGRAKHPLAKKLNEKNLYTDAQMNKADWMTACASIVGVIGIGLGWWWLDSAAAIFISIDILHDGYVNLKEAVFDLMDQAPKTIDDKKISPIIEDVLLTLKKKDWIATASVRLREEGHVFFGEGFVQPRYTENLLQNIAHTEQEVRPSIGKS